jgi:hypothetical protein
MLLVPPNLIVEETLALPLHEIGLPHPRLILHVQIL